MANLIERHSRKIVGALSCFDSLVLQDTLPSVAYPQAMAHPEMRFALTPHGWRPSKAWRSRPPRMKSIRKEIAFERSSRWKDRRGWFTSSEPWHDKKFAAIAANAGSALWQVGSLARQSDDE